MRTMLKISVKFNMLTVCCICCCHARCLLIVATIYKPKTKKVKRSVFSLKNFTSPQQAAEAVGAVGAAPCNLAQCNLKEDRKPVKSKKFIYN
jgi:hypothetical protein